MPQNTTVYVKVGEGKDLPAKDITGSSDPFCTVRIDNEEVARTDTVFKSLSPFWGEEFTLHVPTGFQNLSVYVYDEDTFSKDDIIGKVSLNKEDIIAPIRGVEKWFKLTPVDKDSEVQGEVNVELSIDDTKDTILVQVIVKSARDLAAKDTTGTSDPFIQLVCGDNKLATSVVKKTRFPHWNEGFTFELTKPLNPSASVQFICNDWDRMSHNDFLGQFTVLLSSLTPSYIYKEWYRLQPRSYLGDEREHELGSIRLKVRCTEQNVLQSYCYEPMKGLLLDALSHFEDGGKDFFDVLQEVMVIDLTEMATVLVKVYLGCDEITSFLDCLCQEDIKACENPTTLFRGNSLGSKAADQFMKVVSMPYLHQTLGSVVNLIYAENKYCELDPTKIERKERQVLESSEEILLGYLTTILNSVLGSASQCPPVLKDFFRILVQRVRERFPDSMDLPYTAVSSFVILRFFAAALLSPKLFGLRREHPNGQVLRTLTLAAKILQTIGNLVQDVGNSKEAYMAPFRTFVLHHIPKLRNFIDMLVQADSQAQKRTPSDPSRSVFDPKSVLLSGYMSKRSADHVTSVVGPLTFKKRFFRLSHKTLSYANSDYEQVKKDILVSTICAVERVDKNAFQRKNMLQVIQRLSDGELSTTYISTKNVNEQTEWLSAIRKVCVCNRRMLRLHHPGAYRSGKWTCCRCKPKLVPGCSVVRSAVISDWRDPLDSDMELQTIYSQLHVGRDKIRRKYESMFTDGGCRMLRTLLRVIDRLEKEHELHSKECET